MSLIRYNGKWINELLTYGTTAHSGNTTLTILQSVVVPANTYRAGDLVLLDAMFTKSNTVGIWTLRYYWVSGSTATLSGAIQISSRGIIRTNLFAAQNRRLYIRTANGTGSGLTLGTEVISATGAIFNDYRSEAISNLAINWTVTGTIFCAVQLGGVSDTVTQRYLKIWEW
jgi:hypothetical protein